MLVGVTDDLLCQYVAIVSDDCVFMLHISGNSLLPHKHNIIHFSLHYFVVIPLEDSELSTQAPELASISIVQTLTFSNFVIPYL